ncbi:MAG: hypothetical protein JOZ72_02905 [Alphaproteobacteria bacterium]|nr:hypothetical protein [Alphaproteobacteria bacterium]
MSVRRAASRQRLAGAALVAALHVAIVAMLLQAGLMPRLLRTAHETILYLTPPKPPVAAEPAPPPPPAPAPIVRLPQALPKPAPPPLPGVDLKSLEGFGRTLLDCSPQNIANLAPEDRHRCDALSLKPRGDVDFADHTDRSRDAALWARGRARKNAPMLLPCMNSRGLGMGLGTVLCLAKGATQGFRADEQQSYGDAPPEQVHVPNGGDPHPDYTDPDH